MKGAYCMYIVKSRTTSNVLKEILKEPNSWKKMEYQKHSMQKQAEKEKKGIKPKGINRKQLEMEWTSIQSQQ